MPSNSSNIIQSLRSAHDPHFKLSGKVGGLENKLTDQVAQIHKTLSKSFGMQRKTLMRVLGLEGRVAELEAAEAAVDQAVEELEEELEELGEEIPEGLDDLLDDVKGDDKAKKKKKPAANKKKKPTAKKKKPVKPIAKKIPKKKPVAKKKKISPSAFKKGTSQETVGERIERLEQNAMDVAAGEERQKTAEFKEDAFGITSTGEQLSPEERKQRFLVRRGKISADVLRGGSSVESAQKAAADAAGSSGLAIADSVSSDLPPSDQGLMPDQLPSVDDKLLSPLQSISGILESIKTTLIGQAEVSKDQSDISRRDNENKKREKREGVLEKVGGGVKKIAAVALKPVEGIFSKLIKFLTNVFLGRAVLKLFDWISNPSNQDKVMALFRFLKDWWPLIVGGLIAFASPLLGTTGVILGTVALITWGTIKIIDAIKSIFGFQSDVDKQLKVGEKNVMGDMSGLEKDIDKELKSPEIEDTENPPSKEKTAPEIKGGENNQQNIPEPNVKMNKGGEVPGSGNKDTIPAMLTPGEFVMTKGAVERFGLDTLEGMNAAAGGTNKPKMGGYNKGGKAVAEPGVVTDPQEKKAQENYMLKFVNQERALQGLKPLENLSYGPGVQLTKAMGPGPKTTETSDTNFDFDKMIKTTSSSKTVDGKLTDFGGSMSRITPEEKEKYLAENPMARTLINLKDQAELDDLASSISSSAKMNGGGLVQGFNGGGLIQGFNGGGLVQGFNSGGLVQGFNGGGLVQYLNQGGLAGSLKNGNVFRRAKGVVRSGISKLNMAREQINSAMTPPTTPMGTGKITTIALPKPPEMSAIETPDGAGSGKTIPDFSASGQVSIRKIKTLGITL